MKEEITQQEAIDLENDSREEMEREHLGAGSGYAPDSRPWWKRQISRLFKWHPSMPDLPPWAKDGLIVETTVEWSFADRLRILITGNTSIRTWTACENVPGRAESSSSAVVRPPSSCA